VRFVADESVDGPIVRALRAAGHAVIYVAEQESGLVDEAVLALSRSEHAVLVTADKDFGELVFARGLPHEGVVLLRLHGLASAEKQERTVTAVAELAPQLVARFTVIDAGGTRQVG
jgi:predicted nuclease of predicted toxin-antitoxin system